MEEVADLVARIMAQRGEREVSVDFLGELVLRELRGIDEIAYVRFASVYRAFDDVRAFQELLAGLEEAGAGSERGAKASSDQS